MQLEQQQVSYCCCSLETALALNSASKLLFLLSCRMPSRHSCTHALRQLKLYLKFATAVVVFSQLPVLILSSHSSSSSTFFFVTFCETLLCITIIIIIVVFVVIIDASSYRLFVFSFFFFLCFLFHRSCYRNAVCTMRIFGPSQR